jgi:antitoxin component of MazEF toxin-antitoxin module
MKQKIMRSGNSTVVTVPADFVKAVGVRIGDQVEVKTLPEQNKVIYKFSGITQLALSKNFLKKKRKRQRKKK